MGYHIFVDFDGTITKTDTLQYILDTFGDKDWRKIEEAVSRGEIDEIDGLRLEFATVRASKEEVLAVLDQAITIDEGFPSFWEWCREREIPLTILSGGFRFIINHILSKFGLSEIEFFANEVTVLDGRWEVIPYGGWRDCFSCNHCKSSHLWEEKEKGISTVYIGDGNTDRCAARYANIIFAKGKLAHYAEEYKIPFSLYENFIEVRDKLSRIIGAG